MSEAELLTSLQRGLAVLAAFRADRATLSLSEVAKATDLDRSSARRLLHTLVERGYLRTDGQSFGLHPKVLRIGNAYLGALALPELALPHLRALAGDLHEAVSMAVLDGDEIVYVARIPGRRLMSLSLTIGSRLPAHATSMGRVLLAARTDDWIDGYLASATLHRLTETSITDHALLRGELQRTRRVGWSLVDQELETGLRSIAVPVHDASGRVAAAIDISSHAGRRDVDDLTGTMLPRLRRTAAAVEHDFHHRPRK
ncbi:IclR family transcriptional regulator domain-containing protein [Actinomadura rubrisoli]|uniref:IclR family transcriptional regulator domain-containing protein n=1 Tax=Actinomadura rubrisoli TaxID=2530368 RepID=UPI001FB679EC|nr:IclR family transcriptional regulator C-terminal domain-containing protein [Actinomadura rubrisoli]